jgi:PAS domain S-box-containing protein
MTQNKSNHTVGRLIIVDDEAELMTALCETLAGQGYETAGFKSGADALETLKEHDYDLILTDLMMPEMDGIELLRAALVIDPDIVGIIMTGQGTVQTAVEAMKTGAFDYILKPFKLNTLLPVLSRAMEVRQLRMENMQLRETVAMHELGKAIAFSHDFNSILNKVADAALQQCEADEVSIMLPSHDGKELQVAAVRGGSSEHLGARTPVDQGIAGWVAQNREPVTLHGEVKDRRFAPIKPRANIRAAVSMPMLAGGNLVGVLNVNITRSRRPFTLGQIKALSILVNIVSPILENTSLYIQIRQAEEKYRSIFENATEGIYQSTPEGQFILANQAMAAMLGYDSPEELITTVTDIAHQLYVNPEDRAELIRNIKEHGALREYETRLYRKDGTSIWVLIYMHAVRDEKGNILYYEGLTEDITERKRAAAALRGSEELYRVLTESSLAGVYMVQDGKFQFINANAAAYAGYTREELTGKKANSLVHPEDTNEVSKCSKAMLRGEHPSPYNFRIMTKEGGIRWIMETITSISYKGKRVILGNSMDVTDFKQAEEWLLRERSMVDRIMKTSPAGITVVNRNGNIVFANKRAEEILDLTADKITGLTYNDSKWRITDFDGNPFPHENLPFMQVISYGNPIYGVRHAITSPDGQSIFLSINGAPIFDDQGIIGEVVLIIDDITEQRHAEEKIASALAQLRQSFEDIVRVMGMTIEARDPYTAGHQRRVSDLAQAIAIEMGLTADQIAGIRVGSMTHDIGKISLPSDILVKPTKLTEIEFSLIKTHAQSGYDILKDVRFPWPIARMVLEHHERMDGSGYPNGLTGENLLIESRILTVADVVEAMASHRPYRPGLGLNAALDEITKNKGALYDPDAVDACLRLFNEMGYKMVD